MPSKPLKVAAARWLWQSPSATLPPLLQRQLLVGERLEGEAVQRRYALAQNRVAVLRGGIADVLGEVPAGKQNVGVAHVAVTGDLGDDRGSGNGGAGGIAVDDGAVGPGEAWAGKAVG